VYTLAVISGHFYSGPFSFRTFLFPDLIISKFAFGHKFSVWQLSYNLYLPLIVALPSDCRQFLAVEYLIGPYLGGPYVGAGPSSAHN
jgi:hypothetical protein